MTAAFPAYPPPLYEERRYALPLPLLWRAWTTPDGLLPFFGRRHRVEARVGGPFEILFNLEAPPGLQGSEGCTFLRIEPPQRLAFTWNAPPHLPHCRGQFTQVELRFARAGRDASRLALEHGGFGPGAEWEATRAYFAAAWPRVLDRLAEVDIPRAENDDA